ncbi:transposase [Levilactobacillus sp. HBUAS70063]|uniref:transposase n=1 Tax=Levilactobacillus sp. HBUAS70063 TaxID=3109359 RepID=UPI003133128C
MREAKKNQHYSEALKLQVIRASLNGEASRQEIAMKYGLRSASQVTAWISRYNRNAFSKRYLFVSNAQKSPVQS